MRGLEANGRGSKHCIACASANLVREWGIVSAFFAERALLGKPRAVPLMRCRDCKTQYFDFVPADQALRRLYDGYRGEEYFAQRHRFEPWYTRKMNDDLGGETHMRERRAVLAEALAETGLNRVFRAALDHGGERGQMLRDLRAGRKVVFDISGVNPEAGVESVTDQGLREASWDLILCCHVLEHLSFPEQYLVDLVSLGDEATVFFFEVPDEGFASTPFNRLALHRHWLTLLTKSGGFLRFFDFLSTGVRTRLRILPPFCSVVLREHLTFFSVEGTVQLLQAHGFKILSARVRSTGHIGVVAVKAR
jgi:hypothetical protein